MLSHSRAMVIAPGVHHSPRTVSAPRHPTLEGRPGMLALTLSDGEVIIALLLALIVVVLLVKH